MDARPDRGTASPVVPTSADTDRPIPTTPVSSDSAPRRRRGAVTSGAASTSANARRMPTRDRHYPAAHGMISRKWITSAAHMPAVATGDLPWHREILIPRVITTGQRTPILRSPDQAALVLGPILCASPVERMIAALCGPRGDLWRLVDLGRGDATRVTVDLTTLSRALLVAVARTGPTAVFLAHNHPGGNLQFSWDDLQLTRHARMIAHLHRASFADHLLFVPDGHWSSWHLRYQRQGRSTTGRASGRRGRRPSQSSAVSWASPNVPWRPAPGHGEQLDLYRGDPNGDPKEDPQR